VRYGTALRQLVTVSEAATDDLRLRDTDIGYPLEELWVGGDVLEGPQELDATCVVLVLDQPVAEVTWLALNPAGQWIAERLRMTKLPVRWYCRPAGYPAWNPELRKVLRFWSAATQLDREVMENLRLRRFDSRDGSWRREHRGFGIQPEDHLWRASEAVREIEDAMAQISTQ